MAVACATLCLAELEPRYSRLRGVGHEQVVLSSELHVPDNKINLHRVTGVDFRVGALHAPPSLNRTHARHVALSSVRGKPAACVPPRHGAYIVCIPAHKAVTQPGCLLLVAACWSSRDRSVGCPSSGDDFQHRRDFVVGAGGDAGRGACEGAR